jgi:hypothetical protein
LDLLNSALKHSLGWNIEDQSITSDLDALTIRRFYERCELLRILANRLPLGRLRHGDPDAITNAIACAKVLEPVTSRVDRAAASIYFRMPSPSVGCGTASRTQSARKVFQPLAA